MFGEQSKRFLARGLADALMRRLSSSDRGWVQNMQYSLESRTVIDQIVSNNIIEQPAPIRALIVRPTRKPDWWRPAYLRPKQKRAMLRLIDNRDETIAEI